MLLTYIISGISLAIFIIIIVIAAKAVSRGVQAKRNQSADNESSNIDSDIDLNTSNKIVSEELRKLKELHQEGVLDETEFKKAKDKLLD
tara:strand:- start:510 stop:776 length:267 start_codon:yes stop_codon:yes gene_type:complete